MKAKYEQGMIKSNVWLMFILMSLVIATVAPKVWDYVLSGSVLRNSTTHVDPPVKSLISSGLPARLVALSEATSADLEQAFVFSSIAFSPNSDLIYVQHGYDVTNAAHLISRAGRWISDVDYSRPDFAVDPKDDLFPAVRGSLWGYINGRGEWVISPQYSRPGGFKNGVARVYQREGTIVYIDTTGKSLTNLTPEQKAVADSNQNTNINPVGKMSEGLTVTCLALQCGYVNAAGKWLIAAQFDTAFPFSEGVARVIKNGLQGYIDHTGHWLTPEPSTSAAATWFWRPDALNREALLSGYLNRNGQYLLPPNYVSLGDFSEGLAPAQAANGGFGYINLSGNWVIPPVFGEAGNFSEGLAMVSAYPYFSANRVYINAQGQEQLAVPNEYQSAGEFKNGYVKLRNYNEKTFFMDKQGKVITNLPVAAKLAKPEGSVPELQRLSINGGKWGYADADDNFVIHAQFDDASDFVGEYAAVKIDELWGFINRSGKVVIAPAYVEVGTFSEGLVRVKDEIGWTYIDEKGLPITADRFAVAADYRDGRAKISGKVQPEGSANTEVPSAANKEPILISEGGDIRHGVTSIKLANSYRNGHYLFYALMNNKGELIIPSIPPKLNR